MCGISGFFHYQWALVQIVVTTMTVAQAHRGPDVEGFWSSEGIALGHRRLAILDLSPTGHQPMLDASGELSIVFNSEIYNFSVH